MDRRPTHFAKSGQWQSGISISLCKHISHIQMLVFGFNTLHISRWISFSKAQRRLRNFYTWKLRLTPSFSTAFQLWAQKSRRNAGDNFSKGCLFHDAVLWYMYSDAPSIYKILHITIIAWIFPQVKTGFSKCPDCWSGKNNKLYHLECHTSVSHSTTWLFNTEGDCALCLASRAVL